MKYHNRTQPRNPGRPQTAAKSALVAQSLYTNFKKITVRRAIYIGDVWQSEEERGDDNKRC